ncbi:saxitoxin and tetrodotoxin-binding protein 1-like [Plectropomus leopardus]|uniref:saxitoxin and tetrodotoxin-binding protein 1-like n=1 Tax=Plectropomus leopardus TaxID=160734 RepID=UPI001C4D4AE7|nr:saxitoxin and tetrodotoxin-binding protein 1-like [Plectropomus leopardus]
MTLHKSHNHTLHTTGGTMEKAGVFSPDTEFDDVDIYMSCADCLVMVYLNTKGKTLLSYRREGHHRDAEALKAALDDHRKQSECLGFPHDEAFSYDGAADFCHRKSSPEEEVEATAKEQAAPTAKVEES